MQNKISLLGFFLITSPLYLNAQIERGFTERASFNTNGNIALIGNTLLTCADSAACTDVQNGTTNTNNNNLDMVYVDIDGEVSTSNSSSAELNMPVGANVLFAGLYWGGRAADNDANRNQILFKAPGQANYSSINALVLDTISTVNEPSSRPYEAMADVTAQVQASGNGTYTIADITTLTGQIGGGAFGGWSLAVIYEDSNQPFRRLMLFDGAANVGGNNTVAVNVTGLLTPTVGSFETFIGALSWEGDAGINGDALAFEGNIINQNINTNDNFWNGSITNLDQHVTNKSPNYINQLTMDIDMVDVSSFLSNNATTANIEFSTSGDGYYPHYLAFVTELFLPDFGSTMNKTATDLNGGLIALNDVIEYTISFENSGQDGATNTVLTDPIPNGVTYLPGSLEIINSSIGPNGTQSDAAGDDAAEFDSLNNQVVFRLGDGADDSQGGIFLNQQGATVKFRVTVDNDANEGDIINVATLNSNSFIFPGETFTATDEAIITIGDVTPPVAPSIINPAEGDVLNNNQPSVSGTSEPNAIITVTGPNGESCTTQANSSGGWSCQFPLPGLVDGANQITVTATDTAGNVSDPAIVNITIDTNPPAAPTCSVTPDPVATGQTVTATCTGVETGATLSIPGYVCGTENNGEVVCTATVGIDGVDGDETATTADAAGNTVTSPVSFTIDDTAPAVPTITSPTNGLTVSGTGEPGATVTVTTPAGATCTVVVQSDSSWSCDLSPEPIDGETATATQADTAGNESGEATAIIAYAPDVASFITNCVAGVQPDEAMRYEVSIMNIGNIDITGAQVTTVMDNLMSTPAWICEGVGGGSCDNAAGTGDLNELVDLPAGSGLVYRFDSTVTGALMEFIDVEASVVMPFGTTDIDGSDNISFDSDLIYQFIFKDGFDCAAPGTVASTNQLLDSLLP